ncbi:ribosome maturation protein Sdo1/SBDS [Chloropicon primus]|uniref:Ribosome maturation protein Sdo1/SBDS n=1 Tax=Chloropicon primus TaxID=1764295 RepID=A0A5B8N2X1_9CHLO|nr:ribosome maturation protein Sdo1/SBDS [Chloropicon primus]UPR05235.1 ribosome maturation protein Sdo1/SBDS [Chloropicon primus]|eukprot:QDZ26034.1 ribosome maturation protein Sdo1/SBDS [Chloropicon primus]
MSRAVKQPVGQKRLTNIAIVRYKTHGIRFEIACYKNKVFDWRSGSEQDLDEVLQTDQVFSNVSKGIMAKEKDLKKAFGKKKSMEEVCKEILAKGELQVSDRERALQLDSRLRDVASIIVEKCVDSITKKPFPHALVERALKDPKIRFIPDNRKSAKQQMLEIVPKLQEHKVLNIERARMRVQLTVHSKGMKQKVLEQLQAKPLADTCQVEREKEEEGEEEGAGASSSDDGGLYTYCCVLKIEPGSFRAIDSIVRGNTAKENMGRLEVLDLAVHNDSSAANGNGREAGGSAGAPGGTTSSPASLKSLGKGIQSMGLTGDQTIAVASAATAVVGRFKCNTCQVGFDDSKQHREHFKSDWHRINLKRKSQKLPILSQEECEAIALMESSAASDLDDFAF